MPELIEFDGDLVPIAAGEVLMVARRMTDDKGKRFTWRFFLVVTMTDWESVFGYVVGSEKLKDKEMRVDLDDTRNTVHRLSMDEWPDGVHVFRMQMVLKGLIENL